MSSRESAIAWALNAPSNINRIDAHLAGQKCAGELLSECEAMLTALQFYSKEYRLSSWTWDSHNVCPSCNGIDEHARSCPLNSLIMRLRVVLKINGETK